MLNCGKGTHLKKILSFWPSCQSRCGSRSYHSNLNFYVCGCTASAAWCSSKVELRYEISMPALRRFDKCALPVRPLRPPWTCQEERLLPDSCAGSSFRCLMMFVTFVHNWWLLHICWVRWDTQHFHQIFEACFSVSLASVLDARGLGQRRLSKSWPFLILALLNECGDVQGEPCFYEAALLQGPGELAALYNDLNHFHIFSWYLLFDMCFINLLLLFR